MEAAATCRVACRVSCGRPWDDCVGPGPCPGSPQLKQVLACVWNSKYWPVCARHCDMLSQILCKHCRIQPLFRWETRTANPCKGPCVPPSYLHLYDLNQLHCHHTIMTCLVLRHAAQFSVPCTMGRFWRFAEMRVLLACFGWTPATWVENPVLRGITHKMAAHPGTLGLRTSEQSSGQIAMRSLIYTSALRACTACMARSPQGVGAHMCSAQGFLISACASRA